MHVANHEFGTSETVHELANLILHAGANITLTNASEKTALQLAQVNPKRQNIIATLQVNPKVRLVEQLFAFAQAMAQLGLLGHALDPLSFSEIAYPFLPIPNNINSLEAKQVATQIFQTVATIYSTKNHKIEAKPMPTNSTRFCSSPPSDECQTASGSKTSVKYHSPSPAPSPAE